jgi:DNA-binding NarL/FixJ family response regulator
MIRVAIIAEINGSIVQLKNYLEQESAGMKKVAVYNSIDTFLSDAYMLTHIDVILLDMNLKIGISPVEGISILNNTAHVRKSKLVLLTAPGAHEYGVFKLLCYSAGSYVSRTAAPELIKEVIARLHGKGSLISRTAAVKLNKTFPSVFSDKYISDTCLTQRERYIVKRIVTDCQCDLQELSKEIGIKGFHLRRYMRGIFIKIYEHGALCKQQEAALLLGKAPVLLEARPYASDYKNVG